MENTIDDNIDPLLSDTSSDQSPVPQQTIFTPPFERYTVSGNKFSSD